MKTIQMTKEQANHHIATIVYSILVCILLWHFLPVLIQHFNQTAGTVDASIWLLLLFAIICYIILALLSIWLFRCLLAQLGLPTINSMVSQFKTLSICQQLAFYWASFALLLLAALMSLIAIF
ncbi:MAG: hypothetical protein ACQUHE_19200 [Bacteroidia bacterium]